MPDNSIENVTVYLDQVLPAVQTRGSRMSYSAAQTSGPSSRLGTSMELPAQRDQNFEMLSDLKNSVAIAVSTLETQAKDVKNFFGKTVAPSFTEIADEINGVLDRKISEVETTKSRIDRNEAEIQAYEEKLQQHTTLLQELRERLGSGPDVDVDPDVIALERDIAVLNAKKMVLSQQQAYMEQTLAEHKNASGTLLNLHGRVVGDILEKVSGQVNSLHKHTVSSASRLVSFTELFEPSRRDLESQQKNFPTHNFPDPSSKATAELSVGALSAMIQGGRRGQRDGNTTRSSISTIPLTSPFPAVKNDRVIPQSSFENDYLLSHFPSGPVHKHSQGKALPTPGGLPLLESRGSGERSAGGNTTVSRGHQTPSQPLETTFEEISWHPTIQDIEKGGMLWHKLTMPGKNAEAHYDSKKFSTWVDDLLSLTASSDPHTEDPKELSRQIFSMAFSEISQQVSTHCVDCAKLVSHVWRHYILHLEKLIQESKMERSRHQREVIRLNKQMVEVERQRKEALAVDIRPQISMEVEEQFKDLCAQIEVYRERHQSSEKLLIQKDEQCAHWALLLKERTEQNNRLTTRVNRLESQIVYLSQKLLDKERTPSKSLLLKKLLHIRNIGVGNIQRRALLYSKLYLEEEVHMLEKFKEQLQAADPKLEAELNMLRQEADEMTNIVEYHSKEFYETGVQTVPVVFDDRKKAKRKWKSLKASRKAANAIEEEKEKADLIRDVKDEPSGSESEGKSSSNSEASIEHVEYDSGDDHKSGYDLPWINGEVYSLEELGERIHKSGIDLEKEGDLTEQDIWMWAQQNNAIGPDGSLDLARVREFIVMRRDVEAHPDLKHFDEFTQLDGRVGGISKNDLEKTFKNLGLDKALAEPKVPYTQIMNKYLELEGEDSSHMTVPEDFEFSFGGLAVAVRKIRLEKIKKRVDFKAGNDLKFLDELKDANAVKVTELEKFIEENEINIDGFTVDELRAAIGNLETVSAMELRNFIMKKRDDVLKRKTKKLWGKAKMLSKMVAPEKSRSVACQTSEPPGKRRKDKSGRNDGDKNHRSKKSKKSKKGRRNRSYDDDDSDDSDSGDVNGEGGGRRRRRRRRKGESIDDDSISDSSGSEGSLKKKKKKKKKKKSKGSEESSSGSESESEFTSPTRARKTRGRSSLAHRGSTPSLSAKPIVVREKVGAEAEAAGISFWNIMPLPWRKFLDHQDTTKIRTLPDMALPKFATVLTDFLCGKCTSDMDRVESGVPIGNHLEYGIEFSMKKAQGVRQQAEKILMEFYGSLCKYKEKRHWIGYVFQWLGVDPKNTLGDDDMSVVLASLRGIHNKLNKEPAGFGYVVEFFFAQTSLENVFGKSNNRDNLDGMLDWLRGKSFQEGPKQYVNVGYVIEGAYTLWKDEKVEVYERLATIMKLYSTAEGMDREDGLKQMVAHLNVSFRPDQWTGINKFIARDLKRGYDSLLTEKDIKAVLIRFNIFDMLVAAS